MYESEKKSATEITNYYQEKCGVKLSRTRWHDKKVLNYLDVIRDGESRLGREAGESLYYDVKDAEAMAMFQTYNQHLGGIKLEHLTDDLANCDQGEFLEKHLSNTTSIDRIILATMQAYICYLKQTYGQYWSSHVDWFMLYKSFKIYEDEKSDSAQCSIEARFEKWTNLQINQYVNRNYEDIYKDLESDYEHNCDKEEEDFDDFINEGLIEHFIDYSPLFFETEGKNSFLEIKKDYLILQAIELQDYFYEKLFKSLMELILLDKLKCDGFWDEYFENWSRLELIQGKERYSYLAYTASKEETYLLEYLYVKSIPQNLSFLFKQIVFRNMLEKETSLVDHVDQYKQENILGLEKMIDYMQIHKQSYSLESEGIELKIQKLIEMFNLEVPDYFKSPNHIALFNDYASNQ